MERDELIKEAFEACLEVLQNGLTPVEIAKILYHLAHENDLPQEIFDMEFLHDYVQNNTPK